MIKLIIKKVDRKGFTLVELVVVIAILGILAGMAVPKLSGSRKNAAISAHNANVRTLQSAALMFIAGDWDGNEEEWTGAEEETWVEYLQEWPSIPTGIEDNLKKVEGTDFSGDRYIVKITSDAEVIIEPTAIPVGEGS